MALNLSGNDHAYPFIIGNTKIPFFYIPYENPNVLTVTDRKAYNRTQTIGGQVFEHWGKQPTILNISMRVLKNDFLGNVIGIYKDLGFQDTMISSELEVLKRLYELDQRYIKDLSSSVESLKKTQEKTIKNVSNAGVIRNIAGDGMLNSLATGATAVVALPLTVSSAVTSFTKKFSDTIIYYKSEIYSGFFTDLKIEENGENPFFNSVSFEFLVTSKISDYLNQWLATTTAGRTLSGVLGGVSAATTLTSIIDTVGNGLSSTISNQIKGITH